MKTMYCINIIDKEKGEIIDSINCDSGTLANEVCDKLICAVKNMTNNKITIEVSTFAIQDNPFKIARSIFGRIANSDICIFDDSSTGKINS